MPLNGRSLRDRMAPKDFSEMAVKHRRPSVLLWEAVCFTLANIDKLMISAGMDLVVETTH